MPYSVHALGGNKISYDENGADWPKFYKYCGGTNQSPIDLTKDKIIEDVSNDKFLTHYEDLDQKVI